jgi:TRAP-type mannitol/chloroaromatic compound transport system permease large subunit
MLDGWARGRLDPLLDGIADGLVRVGVTANQMTFAAAAIGLTAAVAVAFGWLWLALVLMLMIFLLGFFFDWIEITLIVMPVFAPIVGLLDFGAHVGAWSGIPQPNIIWFLVLAAVNLQTSFLTPPFGFALFYMKGVAPPQVKIQMIYRGIIPFVGLQLFGLGLCIAFPAIVLWLPSLMLGH